MEVGAAIATAFAAVKAAAVTVAAIKVMGVTVATWASIASYSAMGASMLMKPPGLPSAVHQINMAPAGTDAALPLIFGETRVGGLITFRESYADNIHNTNKQNNLCFESVVSVGPVHSISDYKITDNTIYYDRNPTRVGNATGLSMCVGVQNFDRKSSVFKDGVHTIFRLGEHNDTRTLQSLTGHFNLAPWITPSHRMSGLASVVNVFILDGSKNLRFPMGFPDRPSVLVRGLKCYDPRKDSSNGFGLGNHRVNDPSTWEWSENPYIIAMAFLLGGKGRSGKKMWGVGVDIEDIDVPAFVHGANVADQHGWKLGGQVNTSDEKEAALANILACGAGQLIPHHKISVFVNEPKVSTFTITEKMLVGSQTIRATRPLVERHNRIVVKYREPNNDYALTSGTAVSSQSWVQMDGGVRSTETTYPLIQNAKQAHQIGAYELVNSREYEIDITVTTDAITLEVGDAVTIEFPNGAIEGQQFIVKNVGYNHKSQTIDLTLSSETAGKHDFALGRTANAPAPARPKSFDSLNPLAPNANVWSITANQLKAADIPAKEAVEADEEAGTPAAPATPEIKGQAIPAFVIEGENNEPVSKMLVEIRPYVEDRADTPVGVLPFVEADDQDWQLAGEFDGSAEKLIVSNIEAKTLYDVAISYRSNLNVTSPRLIFHNVESGSNSFDWNDGVIDNLPPVLADLIGGKIKAEFIAIEGDANNTLDGALGDLSDLIANGRVEIDEQLGFLGNSVSDATARVEDAWNILGRTEADGVRHRLTTLEQNGPDGQLVQRVETLEAKSGTASADILSLKTAQTTLTEGLATKATASDLTALGARLTTAEGDIDATNTRLSLVETDIEGTAKASDLTALGSRVTTAQGDIEATNNRLSLTEAALNGTAKASDLSALNTRVVGAEGTITAHSSKLTSLESDLTGKTSTTEFNTLKTEVTGARNGKASLSAELTSIRTTFANDLAGKVGASELNAMGVRVGKTEGDIAATNSRLGTVEADVAGKAEASELTAIESKANNALAKFGTITGTVADALAGKATTSQFSTLSSKVDGFEGQITNANSIAVDALGKVEAKSGLILNANGKIAGFNINATQNSSTFDIMADSLRVTDGTNTTAPFTYQGGVLTAGSLRLSGSININNRFIVDASGNVTLQSATSGQRTVQTSLRYEVYDANRLRVRIGIW